MFDTASYKIVPNQKVFSKSASIRNTLKILIQKINVFIFFSCTFIKPNTIKVFNFMKEK